MASNDWDYFSLSEDFPQFTECNFASLPDTCAWKNRLMGLYGNLMLFQAAFGDTTDHVHLFVGPPGNGRHLTGSALVGELFERHKSHENYTLVGETPCDVGYFWFQAGDFPDSISVDEAVEQVGQAFERGSQFDHRILLFDNMDNYGQLTAVCDAIADNISAIKASESSAFTDTVDIDVICYAEDLSLISHDLTNVAMIYRFSIPSLPQREYYLKKNSRWEMDFGESETGVIQMDYIGSTVSEIAELSEGLSYSELNDLVKYLFLSSLQSSQVHENIYSLKCSSSTVEECLHIIRNRHQESVIVQPYVVGDALNLPMQSQTLMESQFKRSSDDYRSSELALKTNMDGSEKLEFLGFSLNEQ